MVTLRVCLEFSHRTVNKNMGILLCVLLRVMGVDIRVSEIYLSI